MVRKRGLEEWNGVGCCWRGDRMELLPADAADRKKRFERGRETREERQKNTGWLLKGKGWQMFEVTFRACGLL